MARQSYEDESHFKPIRRVLIGLLTLCLLGLFLLWRIDSPRVERLRAQIVEQIVPVFDWAMAPLTSVVRMGEDFQSYARLYEQNEELRRELQQMKSWREAALQLELENARLLDLNNVQIDPELTFITGVVTADSGSPFRRSVLLNVGIEDGVRDGWATMDGLGLVGRIAGTSRQTARVLLLTDPSSRIPVSIQPSGQTAMLVGDNSNAPRIDFIESLDQVRPGDRVVTSGDGGVFPADLLVGSVALGTDRRFRLRLAADYERLEFLRVLRSPPARAVDEALPIDGHTEPGEHEAPIAALEEEAVDG